MSRVVEFTLYVPDRLPESEWAITAFKALLEEHLAGRFKIAVVDLAAAPGGRRIVSIPFVTTDLGGKGKNTYNLDGTETALLIRDLKAEATVATRAPGLAEL